MSGKTTGRRLEIKPELYKILSDRKDDMGWESVRQFTLNHATTLGLSADSVGRAFVYSPFKGLEVHNLINVMYHLEYTRAEIVALLKEYTNDTMMVKLLGDAGDEQQLTPEEEALLLAIRKMKERVPNMCVTVAQVMGPIATANGVDISDEIGTLTRTGHDKRIVNKRKGRV